MIFIFQAACIVELLADVCVRQRRIEGHFFDRHRTAAGILCKNRHFCGLPCIRDPLLGEGVDANFAQRAVDLEIVRDAPLRQRRVRHDIAVDIGRGFSVGDIGCNKRKNAGFCKIDIRAGFDAEPEPLIIQPG